MSDVAYPPFTTAPIVQPPYVAGRWYWADRYSLGSAPLLAANTIKLNAIIIRRAITISDLFARVATLSAGGNFQLAIYTSDPVTQMPTGNAVCTTASISTAATGLFSAAIVGSGVLVPGLYWLAVNSDNSVAQLQAAGSVAVAIESSMIGSATLSDLSSAAQTAALMWTIAQTYGTWPSLTSAGFTAVPGANGHAFGFKVSVGGGQSYRSTDHLPSVTSSSGLMGFAGKQVTSSSLVRKNMSLA